MGGVLAAPWRVQSVRNTIVSAEGAMPEDALTYALDVLKEVAGHLSRSTKGNRTELVQQALDRARQALEMNGEDADFLE